MPFYTIDDVKNATPNGLFSGADIGNWQAYNDSVLVGTATDFTTGTNLITIATHGLSVGDAIYFDGVIETGMETRMSTSGIHTWYVCGVYDADNITVSTQRNGAEYAITGTLNAATATAYKCNPIDGVGGVSTITIGLDHNHPFSGKASGYIQKPAAVNAGQGVSSEFTIDPKNRAQNIQISFNLNLASATPMIDRYMEVWVYDVTNNKIIRPASPYLPAMVQSTTFVYSYSSQFLASATSTHYRILLHWIDADQNAFDIRLDDIHVSDPASVYITPITAWEQFTMKVVGATTDPTRGTVTDDRAEWRRVGDSIEVTWQFKQSDAGLLGAGIYYFELPDGLRYDASKVGTTIDRSAVSVGEGLIYDGLNYRTVSLQVTPSHLTGVGAIITPEGLDVGADVMGFDNILLNISFRYTLPIIGWDTTTEVSSIDTGRRVFAKYNVSATYGISAGYLGNELTFNTMEYDSHEAMSSFLVPNSPAYFVAPADDLYTFNLNLMFNGLTSVSPTGTNLKCMLGVTGQSNKLVGDIVCNDGISDNRTICGSVDLYLHVGDSVHVHVEYSGSGSVNVFGGATAPSTFSVHSTGSTKPTLLDGVSSVGGVVHAKSYAYPPAITLANLATMSLDLSKGDLQKMTISTNTTLAYTNPKPGKYTLFVAHDGASDYTLTFPVGYYAGINGQTANTVNLTTGSTKRTVFTIVYDGVDYFVSQTNMW